MIKIHHDYVQKSGIFCRTEQIKSWHLLGKLLIHNLKENFMLLSNRHRHTSREIKKTQIYKEKRQTAGSIKTNIEKKKNENRMQLIGECRFFFLPPLLYIQIYVVL